MSASDLPTLPELLREHGLTRASEEPFTNDGWSGASLTRLRRGGGDRFILKRDSLARDWIARATLDGPVLREAWFADRAWALEEPTEGTLRNPALGAGRDGDEFGILMPDLSGVLFDWSRPITTMALDAVLLALATLHAHSWIDADDEFLAGPWCPLRERVTLICRSSLESAGPAREAVASRLLPGWDAFDRQASRGARDLVAMLATDPQPLLDALGRQPTTLIHGDLKLANAGIASDGAVDVVDWQMVSFAPIAVELGWFLVANVASLPIPPDVVLKRYADALDGANRARLARGWATADLRFDRTAFDAAILVGLLLRGWRKGLDAEAGSTLASGVAAADDLAWWSERALEAADRLL